jgi:hypothetical protein
MMRESIWNYCGGPFAQELRAAWRPVSCGGPFA